MKYVMALYQCSSRALRMAKHTCAQHHSIQTPNNMRPDNFMSICPQAMYPCIMTTLTTSAGPCMHPLLMHEQECSERICQGRTPLPHVEAWHVHSYQS
jgi:hypothetical protein